jgi:hypothetical protein
MGAQMSEAADKKISVIMTILLGRGLNLNQLSRRSMNLFGRSSSHFIPHNFYHDLKRPGFSPRETLIKLSSFHSQSS